MGGMTAPLSSRGKKRKTKRGRGHTWFPFTGGRGKKRNNRWGKRKKVERIRTKSHDRGRSPFTEMVEQENKQASRKRRGPKVGPRYTKKWEVHRGNFVDKKRFVRGGGAPHGGKRGRGVQLGWE